MTEVAARYWRPSRSLIDVILPGIANRAAVSTTISQHRIEISARAADHPEHFAGRGLVFERLLQITSAPRSSVISRAFSIAITACAAKFCNSAICLSENGRTSRRFTVMSPSKLSSLRSGTASRVRDAAELDSR